jgi:hypothetical protein
MPTMFISTAVQIHRHQRVVAVQAEEGYFDDADVQVAGLEFLEHLVREEEHVDDHRNLNDAAPKSAAPIGDHQRSLMWERMIASTLRFSINWRSESAGRRAARESALPRSRTPRGAYR